MDHIVSALFLNISWIDTNREDCLLFAMKELEEVVFSLTNKKAPGRDEIPTEACKLVFHHQPDLLLSALNVCLKEAIFPCRWKIASFALISEG